MLLSIDRADGNSESVMAGLISPCFVPPANKAWLARTPLTQASAEGDTESPKTGLAQGWRVLLLTLSGRTLAGVGLAGACKGAAELVLSHKGLVSQESETYGITITLWSAKETCLPPTRVAASASEFTHPGGGSDMSSALHRHEDSP